jgi:hypothetical protein
MNKQEHGEVGIRVGAKSGHHQDGDSAARALTLLRGALRIPPLHLIEESKQVRAPGARAVGDGPALSPSQAELALCVRGDWKADFAYVKDAVFRVLEHVDSKELASAWQGLHSVMQQVTAAVARHDQWAKAQAAGYPLDSPPRLDGPFEWHPKVVREAERAWAFKSSGTDALGTTFHQYSGDPVRDIRSAWRKLVEAADGIRASTLNDIRGAAREEAIRVVQSSHSHLESTGHLRRPPKTNDERDAEALRLIAAHEFTSLKPVADECKRLGFEGMSKTWLSGRDKVKAALKLAKEANILNRTVAPKDRKGRPVSGETAMGTAHDAE